MIGKKIVVGCALLLVPMSFAQPGNWKKLIERGDHDAIVKVLATDVPKGAWRLVLQASIESDGTKAIALYEEALRTNPDRDLVKAVDARLRELTLIQPGYLLTIHENLSKVETEVKPDVKPEVKVVASPKGDHGSFTIQIGAFSREESAKQVQADLKAEGISADIVQGTYSGKPVWKIWYHGFPSEAAATKELSEVKKKTRSAAMVVRTGQ